MALLDEAIELFQARFDGRRPRFAAAAPGRVNLIGEHTDYSGGLVLPIAIERETVIVAAPSGEGRSTLVAADLGREFQVDLTQPVEPIPRGEAGSFANYVLGVVEEFRAMGHPTPNLDLLVRSTVPVGGGLSSSASVEVAMATLLEQVLGLSLAPMSKVLLCQRAEHAFPGTPCGIMDMYISTCAVEGHALLIDCRSNDATPVPLPPPSEMVLLIVDTGVKHDLAAGEYAQRRESCERAATILGLESLRDATPSMLEAARQSAALGEIDSRRATHVVFENVRTALAATALASGDAQPLCTAMFESHASLRDLYAVSCPELDAIVDAAAALRDATGDSLLGARMTGGGFGGCAIVFCRTTVADQVAETIRAAFAARFDRLPMIFLTRAAAGARAIAL